MIPIYNWNQYIKSTWDLVQVVVFNVVRINNVRMMNWWGSKDGGLEWFSYRPCQFINWFYAFAHPPKVI